MKLGIKTSLFSLVLIFLLLSISIEKRSRKARLHKRSRQISNKYISLLQGVKEMIIPKEMQAMANVEKCTSKPWKGDSSTDANDQVQNIIMIYQLFSNYDQYLVPEVQKVCDVESLPGAFLKEAWKQMQRPNNAQSIIIKNKPKKENNDLDMFEVYGGFKKNTQFANLRLSEQKVFNIFNNISRTPVMEKVQNGEPAKELRDVVVSSFNPMGVISKILQNKMNHLISSNLFRAIMISMECLSMNLPVKDKEKIQNKLKIFERKTDFTDDKKSVEFFVQLICQWEKLKTLNTKFNEVKSKKEENERFKALGKVFGYLINMIGKVSKFDSEKEKKKEAKLGE